MLDWKNSQYPGFFHFFLYLVLFSSFFFLAGGAAGASGGGSKYDLFCENENLTIKPRPLKIAPEKDT